MSGLPHKQAMMDAAELADAWRIVPRGLLAGYSYLVWEVTLWFMGLPDPTDKQQWFVNAVWIAAAGVTKFYLDSGRDWRQGD